MSIALGLAAAAMPVTLAQAKTIPINHAGDAIRVTDAFVHWLNQFQPQKYNEPTMSPSTITEMLGSWSVGGPENQSLCLFEDGYEVELYANDSRIMDRFHGKLKGTKERFKTIGEWKTYAKKVANELGFPKDLVPEQQVFSSPYRPNPDDYRGDYTFEFYTPEQMRTGDKKRMWTLDFDRADGEITMIVCRLGFGWQAKTKTWVPIHWQENPPDNPPIH